MFAGESGLIEAGTAESVEEPLYESDLSLTFWCWTATALRRSG